MAASRSAQPVRISLGIFFVSVGITYVLAMSGPMNPAEVSPADVALLSLASWGGTLLLTHDNIPNRSRLDTLIWRLCVCGGPDRIPRDLPGAHPAGLGRPDLDPGAHRLPGLQPECPGRVPQALRHRDASDRIRNADHYDPPDRAVRRFQSDRTAPSHPLASRRSAGGGRPPHVVAFGVPGRGGRTSRVSDRMETGASTARSRGDRGRRRGDERRDTQPLQVDRRACSPAHRAIPVSPRGRTATRSRRSSSCANRCSDGVWEPSCLFTASSTTSTCCSWSRSESSAR